ncbi:MAG: hypothetical protein IPI67_27625 [Myxococcales bacterium]|nr:hypothetical protein [Myxococcales bacterium]
MRLGLVILGAILVTGVARPAAAEESVATLWERPALKVKLLEGWRGQSAGVALKKTDTPRQESTTPEPGEALSLAVERMWSQVRAFRRPGGGELIVRGRF